jgi:glycosyltransferase involved in cell wall biosynthesis
MFANGNVARNVRGRLNGLTILRYAHTHGLAGGIEQFLLSLARCLGDRNDQFTTIQMEICFDQKHLAETIEHHGGCRLIKVPLFVEPGSLEKSVSGGKNTLLEKLKDRLVGSVLCSPPVYEIFTRHYLQRRRVPRRPGEPQGAGLKVRELMKRFDIDLVVLHSSGGADSSEIIEEAERAGIPVVLHHHFANDRLAGLSLRQQVSRVAGVAGVYGGNVPHYLQSRFCNVSDGVDTEFYRADRATPLAQKFSAPILFLLSRITPAKGQADLLKVASLLKKRGIRTTVVLAGRVDSPAFEMELRQMAEREGLTDQVEFIGQIDSQQLLDWYAAASVMVFPTHHPEGLPHVLLECQSMGLPPVVNNMGGTAEGVLDRKTGFLIQPGDIAGMADAVETLLQNKSLRAAVSLAGRRFMEEQFSMQALAERHEDFYLKILGETRGENFAETKARAAADLKREKKNAMDPSADRFKK